MSGGQLGFNLFKAVRLAARWQLCQNLSQGIEVCRLTNPGLEGVEQLGYLSLIICHVESLLVLHHQREE